jgi:hypothetical protein
VVVLLAVVFSSATPASAHPIGATGVFVTVHSDAVDVEVQIPLDKLSQAVGIAITDEQSIRSNATVLSKYFSGNVRVSNGQSPLPVAVGELEYEVVNDEPSLVAPLRASPVGGELRGEVVLDYSAGKDLPGHAVYVALVSDWQNGHVVEGEPVDIAILTGDQTRVSLDRSDASWFTGMTATIGLGMQHIAEGTDHMLFLITLMLVAPLIASRVTGERRLSSFGWAWTEKRAIWPTVRRAVLIVLAFTLGHTVTLALVSLGWISFPTTPVEILVAVSIIVAGVHAITPLIPRGEILMAGIFGLVHGAAFATTILDLQLNLGATIAAVLGFNLGVELAQLVLVALILPWLILLVRTPSYAWVRCALAVASVVFSIGWIVGIATGSDSVFTPIFAAIAAQPVAFYAFVVASCLVLLVFTKAKDPKDSPALPR